MSGGELPPRAFRRRGLGRGLDALLAGDSADAPQAEAGAITVIAASVRPNPEQPRRDFSEAELDALAASIQHHGLLQPIVVEPVAGGYQLVAGERRLRAAQRAGLSEIPAVVRPAAESPRESLELALVENLLREDLNPIEEASAYARLADGFGLSHEAIALRLGRSRPAVTNAVRLLSLPVEVQEHIAAGRLTAAHGRALLAAPENLQDSLGSLAAINSLTVRDLEKLVAAAKRGDPVGPAGSGASRSASDAPLAPDDQLLKRELESAIGMAVGLQRDRRGGGRLLIHFTNDAELDAVYRRLGGRAL